MPSLWYSASISEQMRPVGTAYTSAECRATVAWVSSPTLRTAAPSTKVSIAGRSTGCPAASAASMDAASAGSTPTTRVCGWRSASQARQPEIIPPPPIGTTSTSGAYPNCSTISCATVPWPAMVSGWSNAGTSVAPDDSASATAAAAASS